jgi:hypothetical protein
MSTSLLIDLIEAKIEPRVRIHTAKTTASTSSCPGATDYQSWAFLFGICCMKADDRLISTTGVRGTALWPTRPALACPTPTPPETNETPLGKHGQRQNRGAKLGVGLGSNPPQQEHFFGHDKLLGLGPFVIPMSAVLIEPTQDHSLTRPWAATKQGDMQHIRPDSAGADSGRVPLQR